MQGEYSHHPEKASCGAGTSSSQKADEMIPQPLTHKPTGRVGAGPDKFYERYYIAALFPALSTSSQRRRDLAHPLTSLPNSRTNAPLASKSQRKTSFLSCCSAHATISQQRFSWSFSACQPGVFAVFQPPLQLLTSYYYCVIVQCISVKLLYLHGIQCRTSTSFRLRTGRSD
jgi:hypothetical protein